MIFFILFFFSQKKVTGTRWPFCGFHANDLNSSFLDYSMATGGAGAINC